VPRPGELLTSKDYRDILLASGERFYLLEITPDGRGSAAGHRVLDASDGLEPLSDPRWLEIATTASRSGEPVRIESTTRSGRRCDVRAVPIGVPDAGRVVLFVKDTASGAAEPSAPTDVDDGSRESAPRFRTFADTAPAMLWVTEPDGRCSYLSRGWYEFTGQTPAEALGFGWLDAVHPVDQEDAHHLFVAANAVHESFALEHRLRRADGVYRWVIDAGRPRLGAGGAFHGYVGSVIDIHDRKVAEDRLDLAVNSGEVGLWYCDLPFDRLVWNRQVKEHFGLPPDAIVTIETFFERLHPDDREPTRLAIEAAIETRSTYDTHYRTVGLDGQTRSIRAIGRARYDGARPVRFDGITVDVTELVSLRESAEAANRAKDEFLAMLGHELRNPLAPILTALQLLKLRGTDGTHREHSIIERQVKHLVALVDDLLDVSRITRGMVDLKRGEVDLADVVARALEMVSPLLEQQGHTLSVDVARGVLVDGDARRLAQAVANLLMNAAKYTEPGGAITVSAWAEGDEAIVKVRDTGSGIAPEVLPKIFDLFVQERQALDRSRGGLGLGLTISRRLIELHGGVIAATSGGKDRGSEFTIRLPRSQPSVELSTSRLRPVTTVPDVVRSTARVLIVDDNRDAAVMLAALVEAFGYETRVAYDGPSALTEAEEFAPHLALVDLGLPVMDGFELARHIGAHPQLRDVKLVAVTGYGQDRDRDASQQAGFTAHLVKPVEPETLKAVLASVQPALSVASADNP
jgi:PAS domain S-box-containing protein